MLFSIPRTLWRPLTIFNRRRRSLTAGEQAGLYLAALFVVCLAFFAFLLPNVEMAAAQHEIFVAQTRYRELRITNAELRTQISQYTNMDALEARAKAAGFVPADRRVYVTVPDLPAAANRPARTAQR